jgi:hypothetical protein
MGYYIRVLGTELDTPALDQMREAALPALVETTQGSGNGWTEIVLKHASGEEIALIERNQTEGGLGAEELAEFVEEVEAYKPTNAVHWLKSYLPRVKVIYAFQVLSGTETEDGWARLHAVHAYIWNRAKGLLQADGEGFSNEDGYTILWQFGANVSGNWNLAILTDNGTWTSFEMDLGNLAQRDAFQRGEVPSGSKVVRQDQA